jgi:GDP-D-mannose 3',5'-epimerase
MLQIEKKALILGGGGFIGNQLVRSLKSQGFWVRAVDLKYPEFDETKADEFFIGDLRKPEIVRACMDQHFDEIYQLAADMGGAGYVFTGENDADIMHNSALINLNVLQSMLESKNTLVFYSSSACIYPEYNQRDPSNPKCSEDSAYPAQPDSEYGWEKLFSERLYLAFAKNYGIEVRIARYHNIFGPLGTWMGGKEKAPAALCRKVAEARDGGNIEVWGNGTQTRSFLFIDECLIGSQKLMRSNITGPVNIGSEEMISIAELAKKIIKISGKTLGITFVPGAVGVMGRNSDNKMIMEQLGWAPRQPLIDGLTETYQWIADQVTRRPS